MKQEIAELWSEALRSGVYNQASKALVQVDNESGEVIGHCCLGVLCELAIKDGVQVNRVAGKSASFSDEDTDESYDVYENIKFDDRDDLVPNAVMIWAGLKTDDGSVCNPHPYDSAEAYEMESEFPMSLAEMNDSGTSFSGIAALIEKYSADL